MTKVEDLEIKISEYIDGELPENEIQELFSLLAENQKARKVFEDFLKLKKNVSHFYSNIDFNSNPIPDFREKHTKPKYKSLFYYSAAASIVFAVLLLWRFSVSGSMNAQYSELQKEHIKLQENYTTLLEEKIELIKLNNLVAQKLSESNSQVMNSKNSSKSDKKTKSKTIPKKTINKPKSSGKMLASLRNVSTVEITKSDFLGGQVIGN